LVPVLFVIGPSGTTAQASPIKHHDAAIKNVQGHVHEHAQAAHGHAHAQAAHGHAHAQAETATGWNNYLAGGPLYWAKADPPVITGQIRALMHEALKSADAVANPNVEYLLWRRSLDPSRFDSFHPKMGRQLASILPTTFPSSPPQAQQLQPESTPTPSSSVTTSSSSVPTPSSSTSITRTKPAIAPDALTPPAKLSPEPAAIPEPGTLIMGLAMIGTGLWWRSRQQRASCHE
jgi:hypothetical protein